MTAEATELCVTKKTLKGRGKTELRLNVWKCCGIEQSIENQVTERFT